MNYRLLGDAAEELRLAVSVYEEKSKGLGEALSGEFEQAMRLICEMPEAWRSIDKDIRRFLIRRFPLCYHLSCC